MDKEDLIFYSLKAACYAILTEESLEDETVGFCNNEKCNERLNQNYLSKTCKKFINISPKSVSSTEEYEPDSEVKDPSIFTFDENEILMVNNLAYSAEKSFPAYENITTHTNRLTRDQLRTSLALLEAVKTCINVKCNERREKKKGNVRFRLPKTD